MRRTLRRLDARMAARVGSGVRHASCCGHVAGREVTHAGTGRPKGAAVGELCPAHEAVDGFRRLQGSLSVRFNAAGIEHPHDSLRGRSLSPFSEVLACW
jgi:hypothetical protein